jgi:hypothetical protein
LAVDVQGRKEMAAEVLSSPHPPRCMLRRQRSARTASALQ